MNDEQLTGANEYNTGGNKLSDQGLEQAADQPYRAENGTAGGSTFGQHDAASDYDNTAAGTGHTATGTTNPTVDAGGATQGMGSTATSPGGSAAVGSGDSMDPSGDGPQAMADVMDRAGASGDDS